MTTAPCSRAPLGASPGVLLAALIAVLPCARRCEGAKETSPSRPNVVLVLADDLGWGDVGYQGAEIARTPHLDALAADGLRFTRFYAAAPVCSPTRGSALTGRHPSRYGIPHANRGHLPEDETTLAEALHDRGYATGHFGKWHLGTLTREVRDSNRGGPRGREHYTLPTHHGFEVYLSTEAKVPTFDPLLAPEEFGDGESLRFGWLPAGADEPTRPYGTRYWDGVESPVTEGLRGDDSRILVDRALRFIEGAVEEDRPFLAVVWLHAPHLPVVAGERHRALYPDRPLREQLYFGCISALDEQVGRLRRRLRELGVARDTMLWFASDNGPERRTPGSAGPYRGRKRSLYEGGVRVPGLLEWPARIPEARRTGVPCVTSDYLPTVLDVLDIPREEWPEPLDGVSLLPLIEEDAQRRPRPIGFRHRNKLAWSGNRYKLVLHGGGRAELYDLVEDPGETTDIAPENTGRVRSLRAELDAWRRSCEASAAGR